MNCFCKCCNINKNLYLKMLKFKQLETIILNFKHYGEIRFH